MTVTEARKYLEQLEKDGKGNYPIMHYDQESGDYCGIKFMLNTEFDEGDIIEVMDDC